MYFAVFMMLILSAFLLGMTVGLKMYKSRFDDLLNSSRRFSNEWYEHCQELNKEWSEICAAHIKENRELRKQLEELQKEGESNA